MRPSCAETDTHVHLIHCTTDTLYICHPKVSSHSLSPQDIAPQVGKKLQLMRRVQDAATTNHKRATVKTYQERAQRS